MAPRTGSLRLSTTLENEAKATVENEATQTDWMGDLSGGLGFDPAAGCGRCSAATGRTGSGNRQVDGRAGIDFGPAAEVRATTGADIVRSVRAVGAAVAQGHAGHASDGDRRAGRLVPPSSPSVAPTPFSPTSPSKPSTSTAGSRPARWSEASPLPRPPRARSSWSSSSSPSSAAYRAPGDLNPWAAALIAALLTTWVTFVPCFLFILLGAPYVERLRGNRALATALTGITAAVVGVIASLAAFFALHTLFDNTFRITTGPLSFEVPVLDSIQGQHWPSPLSAAPSSSGAAGPSYAPLAPARWPESSSASAKPSSDPRATSPDLPSHRVTGGAPGSGPSAMRVLLGLCWSRWLRTRRG
jgi:hypothetical protein